MAIIPKYWADINKNDGKGWKPLRRERPDGSWAYAMTYLELNREREEALDKGWRFRSKTIPKYRVSKQRNAVPVKYPNATHITEHFTWAEAKCKDGTPVPDHLRKNAIRTARALEKVRDITGKPVNVISWYRTEHYNDVVVKGAPGSKHKEALAVDLDTSQVSQHEYVKAMEQVPEFHNGGIGAYPSGAVHGDTRRTGPARWTSF